MKKLFVFFDVDSTVISIETLDYLVIQSIGTHAAEEIQKITDKGMNGEMELRDSIRARIQIGKITKKEIENLAAQITNYITPGMQECIEFLQHSGHEVFLLTSGFHEYLSPLAEKLNIPQDHVFANRFLYDAHGTVIGADESNPLINADGKIKVITDCKKGFSIMVGDGINDLRTRTVVDYCIGFGAHKIREKVRQGADQFVTNTKDLLTIFHALVRQAKN